jgi:SAM-dependent methyltransferase
VTGPGPAEVAWAARVRANRDQVDAVREVPDGRDFYAPVTSLFRADPRRRDDPVLDRLLAVARPDDVWLDIGAGAGRFALPLALAVGEVIALDPSAGMLDVLRELAAEHDVTNLRVLEGRWPPDAGLARALGPVPVADVALIAHVGYDIDAIGPFLDAMERAVRRECVAVFMERQPASVADPFWPPVHGQERAALPALPAFLELLRARGTEPAVEVVGREPRTFERREALAGFLRRQLWIADGGEKERRFTAALDDLVEPVEGGFRVRGQADSSTGVVRWRPR